MLSSLQSLCRVLRCFITVRSNCCVGKDGVHDVDERQVCGVDSEEKKDSG